MQNGCVSEVELFQAFRGEIDPPEGQRILRHVLGCELCREQWDRYRLDEKMADGIRASLSGDALIADDAPGSAEWKDLPEHPQIAGFELLGDYIDGGQARVYRAVHEASQEKVAIKVFRASVLNEGGQQRFTRELRSLARLRHPHVVPIRSEGQLGGRPYLVMPWIDGHPLDEYVRRHRPGLRRRVAIIASICNALDHAHKRGVMHLDLKPSNVRMDANHEPLVMDFGLARLADVDTQDAAVVGLGVAGTPLYMAPEQVMDKEDVDTRADVYSLGLLLWEILAERRAKGQNLALDQAPDLETAMEAPPAIRAVAPHVPRDLAAVVDRAVSAYRPARYRSAADLEDDLRRFLAALPVSAMEGHPFYQVEKFCRRHFALVAGSLFAVLFVCSVAVVWWQSDQLLQQAYDRLDRVNVQAMQATERNLGRAYEELAILYNTLGDTERARDYGARARTMRERAESRVEHPTESDSTTNPRP